MTTISAKIIADSVSPEKIRLTTMELRYPRAIHAEFMTHRVFSRNAASSRAIPVQRLIQDVLDDPFVPLHWGKNQKGMQAREEHNASVSLPAPFGAFKGSGDATREQAWLQGRDCAVDVARAFDDAGYHKQVVNRLLEPFAHINVVVTATDWANFFHLRDHPDAEPHIAILAREMKAAMDGSKPDPLLPGQWHLPYVPHWERAEIVYAANGKPWDQVWDEADYAALRRVSVARCASVSYKTVDGQPMTIERATELHDKLVVAQPLHASPAEHQATPDRRDSGMIEGHEFSEWANAEEHGNLRGWRQYRKMLPNEAIVG